jgi:hypothetical protein
MNDELVDVNKIVTGIKTSWNSKHREIVYNDQIATKEWNLIKNDPELIQKCIQIDMLQREAQEIVDNRLTTIRELGVDGYKDKLKRDELKAQMEAAKSKVKYAKSGMANSP